MLRLLTVFLALVATVPAAAHALELPGKMRLRRSAYFAAQTIYYPGFTIAGVAEPLAIGAALVLTLLTPKPSADFWLTLVALVALVGMHAVYWTVTHPVNRTWLADEKLSRPGAEFFAAGASESAGPADVRADWRRLRNRWEYSHVARAALAAVGVAALIATLA